MRGAGEGDFNAGAAEEERAIPPAAYMCLGRQTCRFRVEDLHLGLRKAMQILAPLSES